MSSDEYWFECKNIQAIENSNEIFNSFSLSLKLKENTVILGPNGSGKSSIIRLINRTLYPIIKTGSTLKIFGESEINIWRLRKMIGFVSTEIKDRIPPNETVFNIVRAGLYNSFSMKQHRDLNVNDINHVSNLLSDLYLDDLKEKKFKILSDGQKRRVIIARALVHKPDILVLDEPTANLDIRSKYFLTKSLENMCNRGITLLHITHSINSITKNISRVLFIRNGYICGDGQPNNQLTSNKLSELFDIQLRVSNTEGAWQFTPIGTM